jgi:hypothetical protein
MRISLTIPLVVVANKNSESSSLLCHTLKNLFLEAPLESIATSALHKGSFGMALATQKSTQL